MRQKNGVEKGMREKREWRKLEKDGERWSREMSRKEREENKEDRETKIGQGNDYFSFLNSNLVYIKLACINRIFNLHLRCCMVVIFSQNILLFDFFSPLSQKPQTYLTLSSYVTIQVRTRMAEASRRRASSRTRQSSKYHDE